MTELTDAEITAILSNPKKPELNTNEYRNMLVAKRDLNIKTLNNYGNLYKNVLLLTKGRLITDLTNEQLIAILEKDREAGEKITNLKGYLNICIVVKQSNNKPVIELTDDYRPKLYEGLKEETVAKNSELKGELPTLKELNAFMEDKYENGDYIAFVINYLILTFGVRNMDLNLIITRKTKTVDNTDNYIVVRGNSCKYYRYVFKTATTYDCREHEIKSKKFNTAIKHILGDKEQTYLLTRLDGERISDLTLNNAVSNNTLNKIGQGKMFKVLLSNSKQDIETLSANRGTEYKTLIEHYDLSFKNLHKKKNTEPVIINTDKCSKRIPKKTEVAPVVETEVAPVVAVKSAKKKKILVIE